MYLLRGGPRARRSLSSFSIPAPPYSVSSASFKVLFPRSVLPPCLPPAPRPLFEVKVPLTKRGTLGKENFQRVKKTTRGRKRGRDGKKKRGKEGEEPFFVRQHECPSQGPLCLNEKKGGPPSPPPILSRKKEGKNSLNPGEQEEVPPLRLRRLLSFLPLLFPPFLLSPPPPPSGGRRQEFSLKKERERRKCSHVEHQSL